MFRSCLVCAAVMLLSLPAFGGTLCVNPTGTHGCKKTIQKAVDAYSDPWEESEVPAYPAQFNGPELSYALEVAENNG